MVLVQKKQKYGKWKKIFSALLVLQSSGVRDEVQVGGDPGVAIRVACTLHVHVSRVTCHRSGVTRIISPVPQPVEAPKLTTPYWNQTFCNMPIHVTCHVFCVTRHNTSRVTCHLYPHVVLVTVLLQAAAAVSLTRARPIGARGTQVGHLALCQMMSCHISASKSSIRRFVITGKAPTRAFSWLKAATTAFTFKTLC